MRTRLTLAAIVALGLAAGPTLAASPPQLIGDWTGVADIRGRQTTIVWHVGADQVVVDSQGVVNLPGSAGVNGAAYSLGVPAVGAKFEGALSADGQTLTGVYNLNGADTPALTLTRTSATPTLPSLKPAAAAIRGEWKGVFTTPNGPVTLAFHLTDRPTADMPGAAGTVPASVDKIGADYSIVVAGATFTGVLAADGKTLSGTFGKGPLTLTRQ